MAAKDEVSSLHSQAGKDKEAMEKDYQKTLEVIFAYIYGCCAFKHNICGGQPKVPDGILDSVDLLPIKYFLNPRCSSVPIVTEGTVVGVDLIKIAKEPMGNDLL